MMRSGAAVEPERSIPKFRFYPVRSERLLVHFRQVGWLLTACNLPGLLKKLWRVLASEITQPRFHRPKKPRKAKTFRPF